MIELERLVRPADREQVREPICHRCGCPCGHTMCAPCPQPRWWRRYSRR